MLGSEGLDSLLTSARPTEVVEYLLLTQAIVGFRPYEAKRTLDSHAEIARTPVGWFILAQAEFLISVDQGDRVGVERALRKLEGAKFLLRDSVAAAGWTACGYAVALEYAKIDARSDDFERLAKQARLLVDELQEAKEVEWTLWTLCGALDDEEGAFAACESTSRERHMSFVANECLIRHDYPEAERLFDSLVDQRDREGRFARLARAHVIRGHDNGAVEVRKLVKDLVLDKDQFVRRNALIALCIACDREEVEVFAKKALGENATAPNRIHDLWAEEACTHFLAGNIDGDVLIAMAGEHRYTLANVHFTIAMKCLAEGRREKAIHHFRTAVATETFGSSDFEWARMYLLRMEADPTWPQWLLATE